MGVMSFKYEEDIPDHGTFLLVKEGPEGTYTVCASCGHGYVDSTHPLRRLDLRGVAFCPFCAKRVLGERGDKFGCL